MKIFLVGFMGVGKTYWGKIWSQVLGIPFYDLDQLIEEATRQSIAALFQNQGEESFREIETRVLYTTSKIKEGIIACGGGTPCFNDNMEWMKREGHTIYLKGTPVFLKNNLSKDLTQRPLIESVAEESLLIFIEEKLQERKFFYEKSEIHLQADDLDAGSIQKLFQKI